MSRRRRKVRVTPLGYIVLGILVLIMVIGIVFIVWSLRSGTDTVQEQEAATPQLEITPTPSLAPVGQGTVFISGSGSDPGSPDITLPPETPTPTLKPADTPEPAVQTPSPEQVSKAVDGKTLSRVRLRMGPGTQYSVVATYDPGTRLKIYSEQDGFYFVMVLAANKYGYMTKEYVEKNGLLPGETATPVPAGPAGTINGTVRAKTMALRAGPSTEARKVGEASHGDAVYIFFKTGKWYYIQVVSTGTKCYGYAEYIAPAKTVPSGTPVP